ncbi:hypothetical protein JCGZ_03391 [Jatropha curcas]|uniref:SHSP domain-containing protein n=1 Tax=Jatropha curcas TaxID=180498 RepID=A0A067L5T6_JATCU|nr:heat shock 22 kDa protein, mitochondrial [Jatropha curcas]KDP39860.1 hypothetical protein JCGZ_03391 [Jatropha curcas]
MALSRFRITVSKFLPNSTFHGFTHSSLAKSRFSTPSRSSSSNTNTNSNSKSFRDRLESTLNKAEEAALQLRTLHKDFKELKDSDLLALQELGKALSPGVLIEKGSIFPFEDREDEENRYFKIDMPGIGKSGLRVWMKKEELHFSGEELWRGTESNHPYGLRKFSGSFCIDSARYETDKIKAEIKNGVLRIVIPKINQARARRGKGGRSS